MTNSNFGLFFATVAISSCAAAFTPGPQLLDPARYPDFDVESDSLVRGSEREPSSIAVFGYVVDASGAGIEHVQVGLGTGPHGALSGPDGRYRIWSPSGTHTISVVRIGYTSVEGEVTVSKSAHRLDFVLGEALLELSPVRTGH